MSTFKLCALLLAPLLLFASPVHAQLGERTYLQGEVQLYSDRTSVGLSHFRASVASLTCPDPGGAYTISKDSQWRVVFGDAQLGMGGLVSYRKRFELPVVPMTRDQAAAYAQKNPQRKVNVSVTFTRAGDGFQGQSQDFLVRGAISRLTVADAVDGSVLVNKTY